MPFSKGDYLVIKGAAQTFEELSNPLTCKPFGQIFLSVTHMTYVGGPNTTVETGTFYGLHLGEMWIPVLKKHIGKRARTTTNKHATASK